jgi:hypothetical protein
VRSRLATSGGRITARAVHIGGGCLTTSVLLNFAAAASTTTHWSLSVKGVLLVAGAMAGHAIGPVGTAATAHLIGEIDDSIADADAWTHDKQPVPLLAEMDLTLPTPAPRGHTQELQALHAALAHKDDDLTKLQHQINELQEQTSLAQEQQRLAAENAAEQAQAAAEAKDRTEQALAHAEQAIQAAREQARQHQLAAAEALARAQAAETIASTATAAAEQARTDLRHLREGTDRQLADLRAEVSRASQLADAERTERLALAEETAGLRTALRTEQQQTEQLRTQLRTEKERAETIARTATASRTANPRTGTSRTPSRTGPVGEVDRAAVVAGLAEEILTAWKAEEEWKADADFYQDLMGRTGFKRSWCEKVVADAKRAAADASLRPDAPGTSTTATARASRTGEADTARTPELKAAS